MNSKYDNILVGMAAAAAVASIGYGICTFGVELVSSALETKMNFRTRSLALIGICLNVIPMNYFRKRYFNKSLRGVVIGTFLLAATWFAYFGQELLNANN